MHTVKACKSKSTSNRATPRLISPFDLSRGMALLLGKPVYNFRPTFRGTRNNVLSPRRLPSLHWRLSAASGAVPEEDPYQLLGLKPGANSESIQKVYKTKLKKAKEANDEELVYRIETAHSAIMMKQLTQRMQGGSSVSREVAYADKAVYLPWRPRWSPGPLKLALGALAINSLLLSWALIFTTTASSQPLITSLLACAVIGYFKQEELFPSSGGTLFATSEASRSQGTKNLVRCVLLPLMGTVFGILVFYTLPDLFADWILSTKLPFWFYDNQTTILNVAGIFMNTTFTAFYR